MQCAMQDVRLKFPLGFRESILDRLAELLGDEWEIRMDVLSRLPKHLLEFLDVSFLDRGLFAEFVDVIFDLIQRLRDVLDIFLEFGHDPITFMIQDGIGNLLLSPDISQRAWNAFRIHIRDCFSELNRAQLDFD
jgi:hypothetical protein